MSFVDVNTNYFVHRRCWCISVRGGFGPSGSPDLDAKRSKSGAVRCRSEPTARSNPTAMETTAELLRPQIAAFGVLRSPGFCVGCSGDLIGYGFLTER